MSPAKRTPKPRPPSPAKASPAKPPRAKASAAAAATAEPRISSEAVLSATGRHRDAWFALLDRWNASKRIHKEIAAWLVSEHGVDGWWAQNLTVDYEYARGMRAPGGGGDGTFSASASKTVDVPVERLFEAFVDTKLRKKWLPKAMMKERSSQPRRSARFDWEDGATRLQVYFTEKGEGKSQVAVQHERLPDAGSAAEQKALWRERMTALKTLLEG